MSQPKEEIELKSKQANTWNRSQEIKTSPNSATLNATSRNEQQNKRLLRFRKKLENSAADLMALWTPVTISVLTASVMTLIRQSGVRDSADAQQDEPFLESEVELNAQRIISSSKSTGFSNLHLVLIASVVAIVVIVVMSFVMVMLLKLNCFRCLKGYICVAFVILGAHFAVFWFYTASNSLLVPVDWITAIVLTFNFLGGNFIYASLLCGAFSLWDLFAVLCPRGPLNSLIRMAEGESRVADFMQPLVYTAAVWTTATIVTAKPKEKIRRGSRLGLGDFIFYGVLVATATKQCGPAGGLACYTALLVGFCLTLIGLRCLGRALPALPLPVAAAVATVGLLDGCGIAFSEVLAERQLML